MASNDPLAMDRGRLRGFERAAVPILEAINRRPRLKRGLHATIGRFNTRWITFATSPSWAPYGFEQIEQLKAPQGVIMVANHLSFFDMFIGTALINERTKLLRRVCYPVRAAWHYQRPLGVVLNTVISGGAMWPPVFRDSEQRTLNHTGLDQMAEFLGPGAGIGIHPEGRRNVIGDPYTFLPLKPGLGLLAQRCHPDVMILPYFIIGLTNDYRHEISRWALRPETRGEAVRIRFAAPMRAGDVRQGRDAAEIVQAVMAAVREQALVDQASRQSEVI